MTRLVCKRSFCNGKFRSKIDFFEDVFGLTDSEEEGFVGFDTEDIERLGALEDSSGEEEEQQKLQAEDLQWTRQGSAAEEPVFRPFVGPQNSHHGNLPWVSSNRFSSRSL